jgi:hypothetical protein
VGRSGAPVARAAQSATGVAAAPPMSKNILMRIIDRVRRL